MSFFKNILIYKFDDPFILSPEVLEEKLAAKPLLPCLAQEMESFGWLPSFNEGQNYVEQINQALFFRLGWEQKILPGAAVKTAIDKKAEALGVKIENRAHYKELEEQILNELIPTALTQRSSIRAYIDLAKQWLVIDASSIKKASFLTAYLRKTLGSLPVVVFAPEVSMSAVLTQWVQHGIASSSLVLLPDIDLNELKDEGGTAKIKGVPLDSREIMHHLESNWQVARLSLCYDEILSCSLGHDFIFKRLRFLDVFHEQVDHDDDLFLQRQSEAFLLVDSFRSMVSHIYELSCR